MGGVRFALEPVLPSPLVVTISALQHLNENFGLTRYFLDSGDSYRPSAVSDLILDKLEPRQLSIRTD